MSNPQPILVTGALGWLGLSLVQALVQGLKDGDRFNQPFPDMLLRCAILPHQNPTPLQQISPDIEIVRCDLRSPRDCEQFCAEAVGGWLFHAAGIIHPRRVSEFYRVNAAGTRHLLTAAIQGKLQRFIAVSSNSPCGCNPHPDHRFDEHSPYHPYMHYGRSKMQMEQAVQAVYQTGHLETVIIRPPWFYGPNQPPRQTLFFQMIRDGKAPIVGGGHNYRSMAYVDNICQGLLLAATSDRAPGKTYWIADARPYTMNEIVDTVEELLESEFGQRCRHRRLRLPGLASEVALAIDWCLQSLGLYHQKIHVLSEMNKTIACSIDKAARELGYAPQIELAEGMRRSIQWILEQQGAL